MKKDKTGGSMFPNKKTFPDADYPDFKHEETQDDGLTILDYFAAKAMQSIVGSDQTMLEMKDIAATNSVSKESVVAHFAYEQAATMLAEKRKREAA